MPLSYQANVVVPALVPVGLAYAVLLLRRYNPHFAMNAITHFAAKRELDFGDLKEPAANAALEMIGQQSFLISIALAYVPAGLKAFLSGGPALGAVTLGALAAVFLLWQFRWSTEAVPQGREEQRMREMHLGSIAVVTVGGLLSLLSAMIGEPCVPTLPH